RGEFHNKRKDGSLYWEDASISPVKNSEGTIINFVKVAKDVTQRKKAEEKLKEYQEHLEELVKERTIKLDKEILERRKAEGLIREQNERLKELDRMKSEFLSTAAHELRTPLTSILGFSEILLKRKLDEERKNRFLKIINEESLSLSALINDLLDLSRIESGRGFKITKAPIEIGGIILENVDIFQEQTDKHTFKVNLPDDLVKIEADKDKINQVMENLISNALKFSPEGGEITVSMKETKDEVKVSVSDNGMGIPEKDLSHVFEKFYRAENASSEAIGGTGLGLAIVKYIVESHGGKIWVESKLAKGSTFSFVLSVRSKRLRIRRK
ncbi:MAG TPA: PAS domain S-box protein, partial [candidate division CPR3 bacterium]|nr:PAS domain S-box protein [candidate division CPR3 bacterium]